MTKDEIIEALERARDEVRERYRAEIMGFFGSYARGEEHSESDLDVLVEFREEATLLHLTGLGNFLEERLHCPVDVVSKRAVRKEIAPHIYGDLVSL
ncbi:MAG: nucleotidyltransferase family protein [Deltaproteobacteria bacterium]|nr:nucleotidyltransferase family protein [Deltaproteobacteria bacterium]